MKEKVENLKKEALEKISKASNLKELNDLRVEYLGKKGPISELTTHMKELTPEEKKDFGKLLNGLKQDVTNAIDTKIKEYQEAELNEKLSLRKNH